MTLATTRTSTNTQHDAESQRTYATPLTDSATQTLVSSAWQATSVTAHSAKTDPVNRHRTEGRKYGQGAGSGRPPTLGPQHQALILCPEVKDRRRAPKSTLSLEGEIGRLRGSTVNPKDTADRTRYRWQATALETQVHLTRPHLFGGRTPVLAP